MCEVSQKGNDPSYKYFPGWNMNTGTRAPENKSGYTCILDPRAGVLGYGDVIKVKGLFGDVIKVKGLF